MKHISATLVVALTPCLISVPSIMHGSRLNYKLNELELVAVQCWTGHNSLDQAEDAKAGVLALGLRHSLTPYLLSAT
jgi:hypothetical protein